MRNGLYIHIGRVMGPPLKVRWALGQIYAESNGWIALLWAKVQSKRNGLYKGRMMGPPLKVRWALGQTSAGSKG